MIYTDTLYRTFYIAQNFSSGLTDVSLYITAPIGTTDGPHIMTEMPNKPGVYYYDHLVTSSGRYLFDADSVTLSNRSATAIDVIQRPIADETIPIACFDNL